MPAHYFGFSNRILQQQLPKNQVNLFVPVYAILKIKSIQGIDVHNLTGQINTVLLINILIEDLPDPLVHLLSSQVEIQINRSELLFLKEDRESNISFSRTSRMIRFTVRKTLNATISEDTKWSPFEIIRLVVSLTFNSISKREGSVILREYLEHEQHKETVMQTAQSLASTFGLSTAQSSRKSPPIDFNQFQTYTISFNCMRNGLEVPINYSLGCVYSLYDLAERNLEVYHTNCDSYSEIVDKFRNPEKKKDDRDSPANCFRSKKYEPEKCSDVMETLKAKERENRGRLLGASLEVFRFMYQKKEKKKKLPKVKYSQYTHFVIPLYKYPGNALATIFIPVFLLSLLSLAIFFQQNDLSNRIGSIATMVLGYIALIPSIKEQLPPSSRITVIEIVIYISTLCCLFSLVESFLIDDDKGYQFIWWENKLFLLCLFTHMGIFLFVSVLMLLHKLVWEPSYNIDFEARTTDPEASPEEWINFYCDEEFYKTNRDIHALNLDNDQQPNKNDSMITKYTPTYETPQLKPPPDKPELFIKHTPSFNLFETEKKGKEDLSLNSVLKSEK